MKLTLESIKQALADAGMEDSPGAALAALGRTRREIVASLINLGVRGTRGEPESCVFVRYLEALGFEGVYLGEGGDLDEPEYALSTSSTLYYLSDAEGQTVQRFDRGDYPQLE